MTDTKRNPAIYFPEFQTETGESKAVSLFSENSIRRMETQLSETHRSMGGILGLIVNLNRTRQLEKQIDSLKEGLDASLEQKKRQLAIQFEEHTKRIQAQVEAEKEKLKIEMEKVYAETASRASRFTLEYEKAVKNDAIFLSLIRDEEAVIATYQEYINNLPGDVAESLSHMKEYIVYCDVQRKSLDQINRYLAEMV